LGWWSDALAKSIERPSQKVRITACTSRSGDKRQAFQARFGARPLDSYDQVLADPDIDAVILATPHSMHGEHVRQVAAAGKHAFVEKPFVLDAEDGLRAAEACRAASVVLAVGHNRRFSSAAQWLKGLVEDGALGTILHVEANFSTPGALSYTEDRWRANRRESPGGGLSGLGIHMIDLMCWLFGPVMQVSAQAIRRAVPVEMDDTTSALFRFESGPTGYLGTFLSCPYTTFVTLYGTKGNAHIDPDANLGWLRPAGGKVAHQEFEAVDTLRLELEEFAAACLSQGTFRIAASEAVHNVAVMQAIVASAAADSRAHDPRRFAGR
jgi:predicted dehydrogenase